jgi:uncharacterized protein
MIARRFRTLIVQPTTLCNLDCSYCYLPDRRQRTLMSVKVSERLAESITTQGGDEVIDVVWHGGEPLTTPIEHMRNLLAPFEALRRDGRVAHIVQTNATLIDEKWINLFREYRFSVGVSIDGPGSDFNAARPDWAGHDSYLKIMSGIRRLRNAGVPFTVICVVTTETITKADALIEFFANLGCESVAFNIEEMEGLNALRQQVRRDQAQAFWSRLWELQPLYPDLHIRDLARLRGYLEYTRGGQAYADPSYEPIPTVGANGQTVLLSPELLGIKSSDYMDFVVGNVLVKPLTEMLAGMDRVSYVAEFELGLAACAASCEFWDFCRGGQAANRFFEHGSFDSTETEFCRNTRQAVVLSAVDRITR